MAPKRPTGQEIGTERAEPDAGALVASLRGLGYSLETALADLIDNSITARASDIWVTFWWAGEASAILVEDDGRGMDAERLSNAMRLGSQGPEIVRDLKDLGRFGLGLKTASMSQCRRFTVLSRTGDDAPETVRVWDIDFIKESRDWLLQTSASPAAKSLIQRLRQSKGQGTLVLWEHLDRLVGNAPSSDKAAHDRFLASAERVMKHLGVVFHRFLSGRAAVQIHVNGQPVIPWDPFLIDNSNTQKLGIETLSYAGGAITVQPFVLPHSSKLSKATLDIAAGMHGWNAAQGFYIYRASRLIVAGDWLNLGFQKEEHAKLARIQVDLPNSMDHDWHLDVRKARAKPPAALREGLKRISMVTREKAIAIYRHRGKIIDRVISADSYVWHHKTKRGLTFFEINREHPFVRELLQEPEPTKGRVRRLLRMIEETVPVPTITLLAAQAPDSLPVPFGTASEGEVETIARKLFDALRAGGMTPTQAADRLRTLEPFPLYETLLDGVLPGWIADE